MSEKVAVHSVELKPLNTIEGLAAFSGWSRKYLYKMCAKNELEHVRPPGTPKPGPKKKATGARTIRVTREAFLAFQERFTVRTKQDQFQQRKWRVL